jgi:hypothetical protein
LRKTQEIFPKKIARAIGNRRASEIALRRLQNTDLRLILTLIFQSCGIERGDSFWKTGTCSSIKKRPSLSRVSLQQASFVLR